MANPNTTLVLHFRTGKIFAQSKTKKWWEAFKRTVRVNEGVPGFNQAYNHPNLEGDYNTEFDVYHFGATVNRGGKQRVGSFIYPIIKKIKKEETLTNPEDETKVENIRLAIDKKGKSNHYLRSHCYYALRMFGEEFAKYYGIEPLKDGSGDYGVVWSTIINKYVGWRIMIYWESTTDYQFFHYDGLIKEDLSEADITSALVWAAKTIGSIAIASASGGASVAVATATGAANVGQAVQTGIEMSQRTYEDSSRPYGWKDIDSERVADAFIEARENVAEAKEESDRLKGRAIGRSFRGMPRTFSGGRASYQAGIDDFLNKIAGTNPLQVQCRTSEHYESLWMRKMNQRLLNFYFPFGDDPELALKEGVGMEVGRGRDILGKLQWLN